jgi:serine protease AprX
MPAKRASGSKTKAKKPATKKQEKLLFDPSRLDRSVIAIPLLEEFQKKGGAREVYAVVIDSNLDFVDGREEGRLQVCRDVCAVTNDARAPRELDDLLPPVTGRIASSASPGLVRRKTSASQQYVFAFLTRDQIVSLAGADARRAKERAAREQSAPGTTASRAASPAAKPPDPRAYRAIFRIWPDFAIRAQLTRSIRTVKSDAAQKSFSADGGGVVWAVLDSGIQEGHVHFALHKNLDLEDLRPLAHSNFVSDDAAAALLDPFGHGTHVAGIIAGEYATARDPNSKAALERKAAEKPAGAAKAGAEKPERPRVARQAWRSRDDKDRTLLEFRDLPEISGLAPRAKLLSLKVLDDDGAGLASNLIVALEYIQKLNEHGRRMRVHGVNMSVGYEFDPEWFACGHSPLCTEVNRLVRSGVVVVVAAGNTGYGYIETKDEKVQTAGLDLTINDPGNAELAITVGSTHREEPHTYGVSYFSSKGPTGDGRPKPDMVAPGERIVSCGAGKKLPPPEKDLGVPVGSEVHYYVEQSGTSMAAPHVSGAIAAFLSIRREFIGEPERVKQIFMDSATDLHRDRYFQGRGLVDLIRAIQSV